MIAKTTFGILVALAQAAAFAPATPVSRATTTAASAVKINEVESNGGTPGDWVELYNTGTTAVDITGWRVLDNDDTHVPFTLPAGSIIAPGGFFVVEEADLGFGLGAADSARLFDPSGTLVDSYSWTAHATTTYGRCPDGRGEFVTTTDSSKGAPNKCGGPQITTVRINEVESSGGDPGDWIEFINIGTTPVDVSGWGVLDNDDTHLYLLPAGSVIPAGGYLVVEEADLVFGLGAADSVRLYDPDGVWVDAYTWEAHAAVTYGRCPNGTGTFATTTASTKGAANACEGEPQYLPWPGGAEVATVDGSNVFGGNLSGLIYEGTGGPSNSVLWGVRNGPGSLFRLVWNGTIWTPDAANGWASGKLLSYPDGTGSPDSEGVTFAAGSSGGLYVSVERDNNANAFSRNSVLRFDPAATGTSLTATHEWNLTPDLPVTGANLGAEAIAWIPDSFLQSKGFVDESKSRVYNPADYPNHGTGLFLVGLEANGIIYAFALDHSGSGGFTRVATIASGFPAVMDLHFDRDTNDLWAVCDDTCQGRTAVLRIDASGRFVPVKQFERPGQMPNYNNEGFTIAPLSECVSGVRPVFWADDTEDLGHSIRRGTVTCAPF